MQIERREWCNVTSSEKYFLWRVCGTRESLLVVNICLKFVLSTFMANMIRFFLNLEVVKFEKTDAQSSFKLWSASNGGHIDSRKQIKVQNQETRVRILELKKKKKLSMVFNL